MNAGHLTRIRGELQGNTNVEPDPDKIKIQLC
jgi:hypothetical protein